MKINIILTISLILSLQGCKTKSIDNSKPKNFAQSELIIRKVKLPDSYNDIEITYFKDNRIKYTQNRKDSKNCYFSNEYLVEKDSIISLKKTGKRCLIHSFSPGEEQKNFIGSYLFEKNYDFSDKKNKVVCLKEMPVYRDDYKTLIKEKFENFPCSTQKVTDKEYNEIYFEYLKLIKK